MSIKLRAAETLLVILSGLVIGWAARRRGLRREVGPLVTRRTLTFLEPLPNALALWGLSTGGSYAFLLPLLGATMIICMWPIGHLAGRLQGLRGPDLGAFVASSMFSNIGFTFGTFLCYALLGGEGVALGVLYASTFMPTLFTVGFFAGGRYSKGGGKSAWQVVRETAARPESRNPILGIITGLLLNRLGVPRPAFLGSAVLGLVPFTTFLYMFAIGVGAQPRAMLGHWRPAAVMHALKFMVSPALGIGLALALGLQHHAHGDLLRVVLIQTAAPCGIMSMVLSQVKGLNVQIAGANWIATNLFAIATVPLWLYIAHGL